METPRRPSRGRQMEGDEDEDDGYSTIVSRLIERRRKEVATMDPGLIRSLVVEINHRTGVNVTSITGSQLADQVESLLTTHLTIAGDAEMSTHERRHAWEVVDEIRYAIDSHLGIIPDNPPRRKRRRLSVHRSPVPNANERTSHPLPSTSSTPGHTHTNAGASGNSIAASSSTTHVAAKLPIHPSMIGTAMSRTATGKIDSLASTSAGVPSSQARSGSSYKPPVHPAMANGAASAAQGRHMGNGSMTSAASSSGGTSGLPVHPAMAAIAASRTDGTACSVPPLTPAVRPLNTSDSGSSSSSTLNQPNARPVHPAMLRVSPETGTSTDRSTAGARMSTAALTAAAASTAAIARGTMDPTPLTGRTPVVWDAAKNGTNPTAAAPPYMRRSQTAAQQRSIISQGGCNQLPTHPRVDETSGVKSDLVTLTFQSDDKANRGHVTQYSCYRTYRPPVTIKFYSHIPAKDTMVHAGIRLKRWEPYWQVCSVVASGMTAPVKDRKFQLKDQTKAPDTPKTAGYFTVDNDILKKALQENKLSSGKLVAPIEGEYRLLARMLPAKLTDKQQSKRADCHYWPKGTFLQIRTGSDKPVPRSLDQRKQSNIDTTKWECPTIRPLDVTSELMKPQVLGNTKTSIELSCYDEEPYVFSLTLCRYRPPASLSRQLQSSINSVLKKLTPEESFAKARGMMTEVVLDDFEGSDQSGHDLKSIAFTLKDQFTMGVIKTPVRGTKCSHFSVSIIPLVPLKRSIESFYFADTVSCGQCFDLDSFLTVFKDAGAMRWKCCHCEHFICYDELEYCALTKEALVLFGDKVGLDQHMVELHEDRSMHLISPTSSRPEREKPRKSSSNTQSASTGTSSTGDKGRSSVSSGDEIEVIEID